MNTKWTSRKREVVGPVIEVAFPGLNVASPINAKIDTGAYSGALHVSDIREVSGAKGQRWLEFKPLAASAPVRLEAFRKKLVKSSNGLAAERYVIDTEIAINGAVYPISISLADRRQLKYPVLIGRKFLETHKFIIDLAG